MITITKKNTNIIIFCLLIFFSISIISIYSASLMIGVDGKKILGKQALWYILGFMAILFMRKIDIQKLVKNAHIFYVFGCLALLALLIFGRSINGSKCWFTFPGIGSFQPSEFMKLFLILMNAKVMSVFNKINDTSFKTNLKLFSIIMLITLIPSILTFLEPDTGMVIIYFLISFVMLFFYGMKKSIIIAIITLGVLFAVTFLLFFFKNQDTFIRLFGTSFFYRIERLTNWTNKSGMQLKNASLAVKAAGLFGFGLGNNQIYFPEPQTDFIFSVFVSNFGFLGSCVLLLFIIIFDVVIIKTIKDQDNYVLKLITIGYISMIIYQQIQNISMNIGLLPITGITLPFISYGGSSLLSYMIGTALILNKKKKAY